MDILSRVLTAFKTRSFIERGIHFVFGKLLFALPGSIRKRLFRGTKNFCPICSSHLSQFLHLYRPYHSWCPVCQSLARHRFVWHYFQKAQIPRAGEKLRILHIAPEKAIQDIFQNIPGVEYLSGDLVSKRAMVRMDICNIRYPDESFDLIFCSHVLEHVEDDRRALGEFHRVLGSQGQLLLMVPIMGEVTIEDPSITDPAERERLFGQLDHVRAYGLDFPRIVSSQGFNVQIFEPDDYLTADQIQEQAIDVKDRLFVCTPKPIDISES